jgi:uncharacterized protein DUF4337
LSQEPARPEYNSLNSMYDDSLSQEDVQELHEHAEESHRDPSLLPVSFTISVLAVLVAMVTLLGHRAHTHEVVAQIQATDTWAEYQAVNTRRHTYEVFGEFIEITPPNNAAAAKKMHDSFFSQSAEYDKRRKELRAEAEKLEEEVRHEAHRADRFDFGEALLEVALVITSITLLTRRRAFWYAGSLIGVLGIVVAAVGMMLP